MAEKNKKQKSMFRQNQYGNIVPSEKATDTRDAAYEKVRETEAHPGDVMGLRDQLEQLGDRQKRVLWIIYKHTPHGITNKEIARRLSWAINQVTGRNKELRDMGLVVRKEKRACNITGNTVSAWIVTESIQREIQSYERS